MLQDGRMSGLVKLRCSVGDGDGRQVWAVFKGLNPALITMLRRLGRQV
jgi:hypothetical protein